MASKLSALILASRPKTLPAAVAPVLVGTAIAFDKNGFHLMSALAAMFGAILIQIGTNYANDYFDFIKGADTEAREGPTRVTQSGLLKPEHVRLAFIVTFALAALCGAYLTWRAGWPIAVIGLISIASGILYTAGPMPLGYLGLGDVFVFLFFGVIAVGGTYYVQALHWSPEALIAGGAPGLLSTAILTVNNLRDSDSDAKTGKKTLAVRFGDTFARLEYVVCVATALMIPVGLIAFRRSNAYALMSLIAIIPAIPALKTVIALRKGRHLNSTLAATGRILMIHSVFFAIGWIV
ncbi:MAG: 1,4-dihydroxy-2-naphthoate polyprenyltransferase [Chitinivibrionales bacterium]|nr:1,4-dihydroxy-2-naphthoate polyprenyltransferase [Chitinivibrionales bacterium]